MPDEHLHPDPLGGADRDAGLCEMVATDGSHEWVRISRCLDHQNGIGETDDPVVSIEIRRVAPALHPGEQPGSSGDTIGHVRASQLWQIVACLAEALTAARRCGLLPPPLSDDEYFRRLEWAKAIADVTKPAPVLVDEDDEDDAP